MGVHLLLGWFSVTLAAPIQLQTDCPPSFELLAQGTCKLVTRYDQYTSIQNRGVGGLKTSLPIARDGFTPQQIDLGRYLFFDPLLSNDGKFACASCHQPEKGFSDGRAQSTGNSQIKTSRSAPSLWNVAFLKSFFWDARATSLDQQARGPLFSEIEMANTPKSLLERMNSSSEYRRLFIEAYPRTTEKQKTNSTENLAPVTLEKILDSLAAFQSSLISLNSRYDRYAHGHQASLTQQEIDGLNIFRSFVARCSQCHQPPLFTNQQLAVIGAPDLPGNTFDRGAELQDKNPILKGAFRVPTLRNVALTSPYMHSGSLATITDAVQFYTNGRGHAVPENVELELHWHIWEPKLSEKEIQLIVLFLKSLNDQSLMPQVPEELPSGLSATRYLQ